MTADEVRKIINEVDLAHDNKISFEEFKAMMTSKGLITALN